jgi:hypothetical protein
MMNMREKESYGRTPWEDVEIVVIEVRAVTAAVLPLLVTRDPARAWVGPVFTIVEPLGDNANT